MFRTSRTVAAVATVVLLGTLSGCASVAGTPTAAEIDVRTLAVGDFPVDRYSYSQDAGDSGPVLEGIRMSEALAPAVDIDPSLDYGRGSMLVPDSETAIRFLANVSKPVLENRKMVVGYAASGADRPDPGDGSRPGPDATAVTVVLLRFPDTDSARTAARELEDADIGVSNENRKLRSDEHPDAYVHWRPGIPTVGAFLAHEEFVISLFIQRPEADSADLVDWVDKTFTAELDRLRGFRPTPIDELDTLEVDPEGLLARVVVADRSGRIPDPENFAVYGPTYMIHTADRQLERRRLLEESGFEKLALIDNSSVARTRDAAGADRLLRGLIDTAGDHYDEHIAPSDVPGAKCLRLNDKGDPQRHYRYRCFVPYKRYVASVSSDNETEARQKVAAQYALLANSL